MYFDRDEIEARMNEAGKKREPFLFAVNFEGRQGIFVPRPLSGRDVLFDIKGTSNVQPTRTYPGNYQFDVFPEGYEIYQQRFHRVMEGLKRGDSYLTNLTIRTPLQCSLSLEDIFQFSRAPYKLCVPDRWVCFSPECFVQIKNGMIRTFPMKGTIDARVRGAREIILGDSKETAEHNTIVDLLRNDLSRVARDVRVARFRYTEELQTNKGPLLQVSSEIEGRLREGSLDALGTLFFQLLPAGSVSGAPKEATLQIIREAEKTPRGFYTGVAGYFDGESLDSFVLIRFIEQEGANLFFRSGGGITANSDCQKEYEEAIHKVYLPIPSL